MLINKNIDYYIYIREKSIQKDSFINFRWSAPGMNAAIRSVVRTCVFHKIIPVGVSKGYDGLISGKMVEMNARSVKGIINKGGTILKLLDPKILDPKRAEKSF